MNFTRAAEEMHIAQPPLSRQISNLEDELGVRLIDRDARPMRLTSSGEFFKERAQEVISRVDRLKVDTIAYGRGGRQTWRIGFETSVLYGHLPAVIKHLRALNPHLDIDLRALSTSAQIAGIHDGTIDAGVGRERVSDEHIEQMVIREEPLLVALYPDHPLAAESTRALRFADLAGDTFISYRDETMGHRSDPVARLMERASFMPVRKTEIRDVVAALGLVAAEAGVCVVPATVQRMRTTDVCYRPLDENGATSSIFLNFPRGPMSPIIHQTKEALDQLLQIAAR
ncbi:DNA-binding transcriptional LysR family regulator [Sphingomonas leidyi]|uniref:DNA-binding transcriptional LysR family regulator n=2 Tax=Sphingomonas leidyi TaxID=68569 RepID=A0A7X5UZ15_9SPHN|nr:DNA-binding transcriptional LysR family regulator [Sphingomonas leidyi]